MKQKESNVQFATFISMYKCLDTITLRNIIKQSDAGTEDEKPLNGKHCKCTLIRGVLAATQIP